MARKKTTKKAPAKKAAPKFEGDITEFRPALAKEINSRFEKAAQMDGKADDHRLAAAIRLAEAKDKCKAAGIKFGDWCQANVQQSYETIRKLATIGAKPDPAGALADLRDRTKKSQAGTRAKAKKASPAEVAETAIATMDDKDRAKLLRKAAKGVGLSVVTKDEAKTAKATLEGARNAYDNLGAVDKLRLIKYVAEQSGAEVTIFGSDIEDALAAAEATAGGKKKGKK